MKKILFLILILVVSYPLFADKPVVDYTEFVSCFGGQVALVLEISDEGQIKKIMEIYKEKRHFFDFPFETEMNTEYLTNIYPDRKIYYVATGFLKGTIKPGKYTASLNIKDIINTKLDFHFVKFDIESEFLEDTYDYSQPNMKFKYLKNTSDMEFRFTGRDNYPLNKKNTKASAVPLKFRLSPNIKKFAENTFIRFDCNPNSDLELYDENMNPFEKKENGYILNYNDVCNKTIYVRTKNEFNINLIKPNLKKYIPNGDLQEKSFCVFLFKIIPQTYFMQIEVTENAVMNDTFDYIIGNALKYNTKYPFAFSVHAKVKKITMKGDSAELYKPSSELRKISFKEFEINNKSSEKKYVNPKEYISQTDKVIPDTETSENLGGDFILISKKPGTTEFTFESDITKDTYNLVCHSFETKITCDTDKITDGNNLTEIKLNLLGPVEKIKDFILVLEMSKNIFACTDAQGKKSAKSRYVIGKDVLPDKIYLKGILFNKYSKDYIKYKLCSPTGEEICCHAVDLKVEQGGK